MRNYLGFSLVNGLLYSLGWFFCVLGGAHQHTGLPLLGASLLLITQLTYIWKQDKAAYYQDLILLFYATLGGFLMECLFLSTGWVHYKTLNSFSNSFPPGWLLALYPLFSLTLNHALHYLNRHKIAPLLFGVLGAPLSYLSGEALGAVTLSQPKYAVLIGIAFCWTIYLFLLIWINKRLHSIVAEVLDLAQNPKPLALLYDGECPLCKREVDHLKKNAQKIEFVNITSPNYEACAHQNISYSTAMQQMHAIKGDGEILKGTDAFKAVYAQAKLPFLSMLLKAPLFSSLFKQLYKIFARYRLALTGRSSRN